MRFNTIFQYFVPKDDKFTTLFELAAANLLEATELLKILIVTEDVAKRNEMVQKIKDYEKKGDEYTHTIFDELNKNFITPFDREDIQSLTSCIDDVLDNINSACFKIKLYKPKKLTVEFEKMCEYQYECAKEILKAVRELKHIKNSKLILNNYVLAYTKRIENTASMSISHVVTSIPAKGIRMRLQSSEPRHPPMRSAE